MFSQMNGWMDESWATLEEDYIAFLLSAPKCTNCIKQVLMLELSKQTPILVLALAH
jgi:hypothetical protein